MKKIVLLTLCSIFCVNLFYAQNASEKKAKEILDQVSSKLKTYSSIEADFTFSMTNKKSKINETQNGKIITKGKKYNLKINNRNVISDGITVWTIMTDVSEITINNPSNDEDAINPSSIFTLWEKGFKYKFIKEESQAGKMVEIIDLTPIKGKPYHKVRLIIDKAKKQIISSTIYEKNGTVYTYNIKTFTTNKSYNESKFSFKSSDYPKAEIIDMR